MARRQAPMLYIIQAHQKPDQVRQLVELLDDGDNRYLVNLDPAGALAPEALLGCLPGSILPRVTVRRGLPATWGGISQVHAWLDAYSYAAGRMEGWDHVAVLSGACIPLVSQAVVKRFLRDRSADGVRAHLGWWDWEARGESFHLLPLGDADAPALAGVEMALGGSVPALVEAALKPVFADEDRSPIHRAQWRGAVHCTDCAPAKRLLVRRLLPHEAQVRRQAMQALPVTGGWMWCVLRRDAVEDILADPLLPGLLDMLAHFICPDELFLHTLLRNSRHFPEATVGRWSCHFRQGLATELSDHRLGELAGSGAFFARKADYDRCPELVGHVRHLVRR